MVRKLKHSFRINLRDFLFGAVFGLIVIFPVVLVLETPTFLQKAKPPPVSENFYPAVSFENIKSDRQKQAPPASASGQVSSPSALTKTIISGGVPILMYHYVGNNPNPKDLQRDVLEITPEKFMAQMDFLKNAGFTPITLNTMYGIFSKQTPRPAKPIILSFDDGYIDFYFNAFPILRSHGFVSVAFIPTGLIGKPAYMTWDQIKQINATGMVDFEAHTVNHVDLTRLPYDKALWELKTSKDTLQTEIGHPVNFIAYPYGSSNSMVWKEALDAGFIGGTGTWPGRAVGPGINIPRVRIVGPITLPEFAAKVNG